MNYKGCMSHVTFVRNRIIECIGDHNERTKHHKEHINDLEDKLEAWEHFAKLCKSCGCNICMGTINEK